jgi:hypothetical protein
MAWCPFATHKPLSENHTQGSITPRAVILHTAVSSSNSLFDFFQNSSNLESHFYVTDSGAIEQYMDTRVQADANKNANGFAVSIETEDGREIRPWTDPQLAALIRLCIWICDTHSIPKVQIPTANGSGIGWHVMFGAPGPWTPVAKVCPGAPRIAQTKTILIPAVASGVAQVGDDMQLTDEVNMWKGAAKARYTVEECLASAVGWGEENGKRIQAANAGLMAAIAALANDQDITVDEMRQIVNDAVEAHVEITGTVQISSKQ